MRANVLSGELLQSMNFPPLPLNLEDIVSNLNCKLCFEDLYGPSGLTYKKFVKGQWKYIMYIASDMDPKYSEQQIINRQRYTIAHEIGHIVLHSHLDWNDVDDDVSNILEVEANWFASRLLMPDYAFTSTNDLESTFLSHKCGVNFQAAHKRLSQLDRKIVNNLLRQATDLANFARYEEIKEVTYDIDFEKAYEEIASTEIEYNPLVDPDLFCFNCGQFTEDNRMTFIVCQHCGNLLRYMK